MKLEKDDKITYQCTNKRTLITIKNYRTYQDRETDKKQEKYREEIEENNLGNTIEYEMHTNKNEEEFNNDKEEQEWKNEDITFPTIFHEKIFKTLGYVAYETWFSKATIDIKDDAIWIKHLEEFQASIIDERFKPKLKTLFNKEINVSMLN